MANCCCAMFSADPASASVMQRMSDMLTRWLEGTLRRAETTASNETSEEPSASSDAAPVAEVSEQYSEGVNNSPHVYGETFNTDVSRCDNSDVSIEGVNPVIGNVDEAAANYQVCSAVSTEAVRSAKSDAGSSVLTETDENQTLPKSDICFRELKLKSFQNEWPSSTDAERSISHDVLKSTALETASTAGRMCGDDKQLIMVDAVPDSEYETSCGTLAHTCDEQLKDCPLRFNSSCKETDVHQEKPTGTADDWNAIDRNSDQLYGNVGFHTSLLEDVNTTRNAGSIGDAATCLDNVAKCDKLHPDVLLSTPSQPSSTDFLELPFKERNAPEETARMLANQMLDEPVSLTTSHYAPCTSRQASSTEVSYDSESLTTDHCTPCSSLQASSTAGVRHYLFVCFYLHQ